MQGGVAATGREGSTASERRLRAGDVVEVRSAAEILATLDDRAELAAIPFMPEMLPYVGRRFRVASRALKVCTPSGNTHLEKTVFLEQLRCDGSAHGGCEAECRLYWREEWLRLVSEDHAEEASGDDLQPLAERANENVRWLRVIDDEQQEVFHCQATEAARSGPVVPWAQTTQYVRELTSGNVGAWHFTRVMAPAFLRWLGRRLRVLGDLPGKMAGPDRVDGEELGLEPGDWVEVRPFDEIAWTLDDQFSHRGLTFHYEMVQHCGSGKRYRVRRRLNRLIDEGTGKMIEMRRDLIALDGLVCTGDRAEFLWFCRRELYPYWREAWLRRVAGPADLVTEGPEAPATTRPG